MAAVGQSGAQPMGLSGGQFQALLALLPAGVFVVSVRAPLTRRQGADDLCRRFPGGGGRPAAAGINELPDSLYDDFVAAFLAAF